MTITITTSIQINAPPSQVRHVFHNYNSHQWWNPYIINFSNHSSPNARAFSQGDILEIRLCPIRKIVITIYPKLLVNNPREFTTRGVLWWRWILIGTHTFRFEEVGGGTVVAQEEKFHGGVLSWFWGWFGLVRWVVSRGFGDMNYALKREVERMASEDG